MVGTVRIPNIGEKSSTLESFLGEQKKTADHPNIGDA